MRSGSVASGPRSARARRSRVAAALACAGVLAAVATAGLVPVWTNDTWIHLTTGRLILEEGAVPRTDRYSFTAAGNRYVAHEWLAAVVYALGERAAGLPGVVVVGKLLPALATAAALLAALRAAGASLALGTPLAVLAFSVARLRIMARPEMLALPLLLALLALLLRDRSLCRAGVPSRALLWALPLTALWVNLHGSFVIGIALVVAFAAAAAAERWLPPRDRTARLLRAGGLAGALGAAGLLARTEPAAFGLPAAALVLLIAALFALDGVRPVFADPSPPPRGQPLRLLLVAAGMLAASLFNPRGAEILLFPFEFTADVNEVTLVINEWRPLLDAPHVLFTQRFVSYLLFLGAWLGALALATRRRALGRGELFCFLLFALLPLRHERWMGLTALATTPALASLLGAARDRLPAPTRLHALAGWTLGALAAGCVLLAAAFGSRARPDWVLRAVWLLAGGSGGVALALGAFRRLPLPVGSATAAAAGLATAALAVGPGVPEDATFRLRPDLRFEADGPRYQLETVEGAVRFLERSGLEGRLHTEYDWAGYVIHELWPRIRVFIDSRSEVYGQSLLRLHRAMKADPRWARHGLRQYGADLVLLRYSSWPWPDRLRENAGLLGVVAGDPQWALVYVDDWAVLYARAKEGRELPQPFERLDPRRLHPVLLEGGDPALAAELRRALALAPHSSFLRFALVALEQARDGASGRDAARAELLRAWESNPRHPAAPYLAARLAHRDGDEQAARLWLERARFAYPDWDALDGVLAESVSSPAETSP